MEVVGVGVEDDGPAEQRVGVCADGDVVEGHFEMSVALGIGLDIAEVAGVVGFGVGRAVRLVARVEMPAGAGAIGGGEVAELVDVEAVDGIGRQAGEVGDDGDGVRTVLGEADGAGGMVALGRLKDSDGVGDGVHHGLAGHVMVLHVVVVALATGGGKKSHGQRGGEENVFHGSAPG